VYDALSGPMLPECRIEQWVHEHHFRAAAQDPSGQTEFTVSLGDCVYGDSLFNKPILLAFLSPTINVHQTYMGGDKLGHLFQHGYQYYEEYRDARTTAVTTASPWPARSTWASARNTGSTAS